MRTQLGHQWRGLTAGVIAGLAWTAAKVAVPALVAVAIDRGIGDGSNSALVKWSLAILVAGVVAGICSGLRRWFAFREARWSEAMLRDRLPIGPPDLFAEKLTALAKAGAQRVFIWPVADEVHQLERFWNEVRPLVVAP